MKTLLRILIILLAAALISGATHLLVNQAPSAPQGMESEGKGPGGGEGQGAPRNGHGMGEGRQHPMGERLGVEGFAWLETVRSLIVVTVAVVAVVLVEKRLKRSRKARTAGPVSPGTP